MRFHTSPFRLFFYIFFPLLIIPLAAQLALGQSPPSLAQSSPPTRKAPPPPPPPPATDQEQFISYWTTETGWASELELQNNQTAHDLTVTPVLRSADGAETSLPAVTIKPLAAAIVDLGAATLASAPQLVGTHGSIVLRYNSPSQLNLHADLMIRGIGHPFAFHIDAMGQLPYDQAATREGIWWLPKDTTSDYLILTNQGSNPLPFVLTLYDAVGKQVSQSLTLPPRATGRYSVRQLVRSAGLMGYYGGIKVSPSGHAGSLDTLHILFDEKAAFSALLKMFDHDPRATLAQRDYAKTAQWTLRAPMLALTSPDPVLKLPAATFLQPQLFVRNTTAKPVEAALRFHWRSTSAAGSAPGPRMHLNPYETRRIDVAALQEAKTLPSEAHWASVILTTNSLPDEVMAVAASYDPTMRYGSQTPFSDQLASHWAGSLWEYDAQHDSVITVGNGGTQPTLASLAILYNQGTAKYEVEQSLQPDEQMWIEVGKLIREHVRDKNGKTLPEDLTSGSYEIRDLTHKAIGTLFEGKLTVDKTYGHAAYGCAGCCGYKDIRLFFNPLGIPVLSTSDNGVEGIDMCSGSLFDLSDSFYGNWSTANTTIAIVDSYGTHTGKSAGSTTSSTWGDVQFYNPRYNCPILQQSPSGNDNVMNLICSPSSVARGSSTTCTVNNPPSGATYSNWQFKDSSNNTVSGSGTSSSWSGAVVTSGTVSVKVTSGNSTPTLTATITVTNRTNFAFTAVTSSQVMANTLTCYDGTTWVLASPPAAGSYEGRSCADQAFSFSYAGITDGGPNNGYGYVTSVSNSSGSSPTKFEYIVVSDLLTATQFYTAQCGTFSSSNTSGFIAGSQLKQNVFDHEQGSVLSHWTEYRDAQNNSSNNIGAVLEPILGTPGMSGSTYQQNLQNAGNAALTRISTAVAVEPCKGLVTCDSSQVCKTCGAINFTPYQSCGNATPIPYCQ